MLSSFFAASPLCSGASSETRFTLKALLSFSVSNFETGCFQAGVELASPYRRIPELELARVFRHVVADGRRQRWAARRGRY